MTVVEKVREMSDEQLAKFIMSCRLNKLERIWCSHLCPYRHRLNEDCNCTYGEYETILGYLQSEAEEVEALVKMGGK